ncbi:MAG TPA: hypothetical protein VJN95_08660 [Gemmatimonadales bacterium]|nr:hypothetical protein [Gemmatimonadales bacterium]
MLSAFRLADLPAVHTMRRRLGGFVHSLRRGLPELLFVFGFLLGWGLLSLGFALLLGPIVWPFAGGILLLSACGWKMLFVLARDGLYALTKDEPR